MSTDSVTFPVPPPTTRAEDAAAAGEAQEVVSVRAAPLHAFLAFASATAVWMLCVAIAIFASLVCLFVPVVLLAIWARITGQEVSDAVFDTAAGIGIVMVTVALLPWMSTAILRFSLRLSPLPVGTAVRFSAAPVLWLAWLLLFIAFVASGSEWITLLVASVIAAGGMGRVYHFRRHWQGLPRGRTVLFLRRFGKSADRLVSTAIRRAAPEGAYLAFLVGSRQNAASWDPLVIAFDGLGRRRLPLYLQSTDGEWVGHVREMVMQADAVVLDATDWSEAMDAELAIVDACGASDRLIVLARAGQTVLGPVRTRQQLRYRVSWRQAGHRIFWGFMLALLPAAVGDTLGWSLMARVMATLPALGAWLLLAVRPLMDESATDDLTARLRASGTRTRRQ